MSFIPKPRCRMCGETFDRPADSFESCCSDDCREWLMEQANEAGMLHGLDARNEVLGRDEGHTKDQYMDMYHDEEY